MSPVEKPVSYKDVALFALHYAKRHKRFALGSFGFLGMATLTDAFMPLVYQKIVNTLMQNYADNPASLRTAVTFLLLAFGMGIMFHTLRWRAFTNSSKFFSSALHDVVIDGLHKVQRFSTDWHANSFAGGTVRKITRGMWAYAQYGNTIYNGLFPAAMMMLAMTTILLIKLPIVGLIMVATVIIYCVLSVYISVKILAPLFRASAERDTKIGATLADIITGNPTVKSFGAERREDAIFSAVAEDWRVYSRKAWTTGNLTDMARGLCRSVMFVGMLGATVWLWKEGRATAGDITLTITSFGMVAGYIRDIGQHIADLQRSTNEMEDIVAFWLRQDDLHDSDETTTLKKGKGEVVFDNVTFSYGNARAPLYNDFSLRIAPGEKVALVGHSGSGKSTFVKLVQRLYDVQSGEIKIDGQNIAAVTQESLRQAVALVPQDPILFHRSLAANIAYGCPDATMEQIIDAAKQAHAHEFIENLPLGYDTLVGERGIKLSGGERQRVAIARAILADTPVLILDEATSSLDSVSEHYIQAALKTLMEGRTTITIAHRLATIRQVDRILVFDAGRIVEQGTHAELIANPHSHYRRLYEIQALGLTEGLPADLVAA
jgi:ATP-binding cassette subfamily B protein